MTFLSVVQPATATTTATLTTTKFQGGNSRSEGSSAAYVVLSSKPGMKLIAWLAGEFIRLPMERNLKQQKRLPIYQPQNLLLPFRY